MKNLKLYGYWRSSATYRVRIGLAYKELSYDYSPVHLRKQEQTGETYTALNPLEQVPTLEWQEGNTPRRLTQSLPILEYLDERHPERPLLPRDGYLRARARQLAEVVNAGIQPLQNLPVLARLQAASVDKQAWLDYFLGKGLAALEALSADTTSGQFLVGDHVTVADLCLIPQLEAARRLGVDVAPYARLLAVEKYCLALPCFVAARPEAQPDAEVT